MLAGLAPGQLYFRAQLAIASLFLGATATAMLVYAKQIIGAASQISGFARRIEFPRMVTGRRRQSAHSGRCAGRHPEDQLRHCRRAGPQSSSSPA